MDSNHLEELEEQFAANIATQVQRSIDDDQNELNQQDHQKSHRNLEEKLSSPIRNIHRSMYFVLFDGLNDTATRTFLKQDTRLRKEENSEGKCKRRGKGFIQWEKLWWAISNSINPCE